MEEVSNCKGKELEKVCSYKTSKDFPKEATPNQIYIDRVKNSILVPFKDEKGQQYLVPFHTFMIKNASLSTENSLSSLRINFHVPGSGVSIKELNFPKLREPNSLFVKELTIKSKDPMHLTAALKAIRDLLRKTKIDEQMKVKSPETKEADQVLADESLIMAKANKKLVLDNVCIKPSITGKKTSGALEVHCNGFRFVSTKGNIVDLTYKNIRHAFFQPCQNDLIVLLHFRLRAPIQVGSKKVIDVQF